MAENGEICLNPPFTWIIINLHKFIKKHYFSIFSPDFIFRGAKWYLAFKNHSSTEARFNLVLKDLHGLDPRYVSYSLSIVDTEGEEYWSSNIETKNFTRNYCSGFYHRFRLADLWRDLPKITRGGVLSFRLQFYPEDPLLSPTVQGASWNATTVGTQTSDYSSGCQSCSSRDGSENVLQSLKHMYLTEKECDFTINVQGRIFGTHQLILKCHSPVFDSMLQHPMQESSSGAVEISDCDPDAFHNFLIYIYSGELKHLTSENVVQLLYISEKYGVKKLSAECNKFMIDNLTVETFCDFVTAGIRLGQLALIKSANDFFVINFKLIRCSEKWKKFCLENQTEAFQLQNKVLDQIS